MKKNNVLNQNGNWVLKIKDWIASVPMEPRNDGPIRHCEQSEAIQKAIYPYGGKI